MAEPKHGYMSQTVCDQRCPSYKEPIAIDFLFALLGAAQEGTRYEKTWAQVPSVDRQTTITGFDGSHSSSPGLKLITIRSDHHIIIQASSYRMTLSSISF